MKELFRFDPVPSLSHYHGPKLSVITHGNDTQYSLHRLVPDFPHVVVAGTGHWIYLDKAEDFNGIVEGFLRRIDGEIDKKECVPGFLPTQGDEIMKAEVECIEISWDGPFTLDNVKKLNNGWDYGLYQIYGTHNIFGADSLLYIGKAEDNSFAQRIAGHKWWVDWESAPVQVYVGRLGGTDRIDDGTWGRFIDIAERLLIYYSSPPYNSQYLLSQGNIKSTLVINHKRRHRLPMVVTSLENESMIGSPNWREYGRDEQ